MSRSSADLLDGLRCQELDRLSGPGQEERRLANRLRFMLLRRWPESVVRERLRRDDMRRSA